MKGDLLRFGTAAAAPGRKAWGQLLVRGKRRSVRIPTAVVHGARPGPHLVIVANQHGGEVNGFEATRRFLDEVNPRKVRGTIFVVPSANPEAAVRGKQTFNERRPDAPGVGYFTPYNMNYLWPGARGKSLVAGVAHAIWTSAVFASHAKATLVLDVHCHAAPSAIYAGDRAAVTLGVATGLRHVYYTRASQISQENPKVAGSLEAACRRAGIRCLLFELHRQYELTPSSVEEGVRAINHLLIAAGALQGRLRYEGRAVIHDPWHDHFERPDRKRPSFWAPRARSRGVVLFFKRDGDLVRRGEAVCVVLDPFRAKVTETHRSAIAGIFSGRRLPLVEGVTFGAACARGARLCVVARFWRADPTAAARRVQRLLAG